MVFRSRSGRAGGRLMAKRFGRNQRREMLALFKQLENDRLFGCAPAEPEDFVMSALPCELKTFSVTDEYERGRVERRVTCEMVVRAELKGGRAIEDAYVHSRFFNIDGRRYHLSHVSSEPAVFSNDHFLTKIDEYGDRYRLARSEEHTSELQSLMRIS